MILSSKIEMMSLSILWTLLLVATVKARSEVSITEAGLVTENSRSDVAVADVDENALKTDAISQDNADIEDAILSRMGFDALSHPSSTVSDSDSVNLEKALDEKLQDISDTLSRLSGMEPDEVSDTNYDNLVNLKSGFPHADEVYNQQDNLRNDVLRILDGSVDDVSVLGVPSRAGVVNVHNLNRHNLYPVNHVQGRSNNLWPFYNVRNSGYKKLNINDGLSYTDPNNERELLLSRLAALNGIKESKLNNLNNLFLAKTVKQDAVNRGNHLFGSGRRFIGRQGLSNNDLVNVKVNVNDVAAIDEDISNRRNFIDSEEVNRNDNLLNVLKKNALNNLNSNVLNNRNLNRDIDGELASIIVNVRSGNNGIHGLNKVSSSADASNVVNALDHVSRHGVQSNRHGVRKSSVNDLNQVKYILSNLDSNAVNTKVGGIDANNDLASIIADVRASGHELNELNKISSFNDDSNDVSAFDHLNKHGLRNNKKGLKVSLNDLNNAKRLLGPITFDKVTVANRVSNEIDEALINALNVDDDFNALGALAVLNKAAAKASENLLLNNIIGRRSDADVESIVLGKLGVTEDSEVNGVASNNPLDEVVNSLVILSRIDANNDAELSVNSEYSPENLSRSHKNLLHNFVDSQSDAKLQSEISEDEVDDIDSLLSRVGNRWNRNRLRNKTTRLYNPQRIYRPSRPSRPYRPYRTYRPNRPVRLNNGQRYWYRSSQSSELNEDENQSDLDLSTLTKLNNVLNVRNVQNEPSVDNLLSTYDKSIVGDVSAGLSQAQLKNLVALADHEAAQVHAKNNLNHVSEIHDVNSVRQSVTQLDKNVRDANNLLLAGGLSNLNGQRQKVSGRSNAQVLSGEDKNNYDNVVLVPVRVGNGAVLKKAGGPYDISELINLNVVY